MKTSEMEAMARQVATDNFLRAHFDPRRRSPRKFSDKHSLEAPFGTLSQPPGGFPFNEKRPKRRKPPSSSSKSSERMIDALAWSAGHEEAPKINPKKPMPVRVSTTKRKHKSYDAKLRHLTGDALKTATSCASEDVLVYNDSLESVEELAERLRKQRAEKDFIVEEARARTKKEQEEAKTIWERKLRELQGEREFEAREKRASLLNKLNAKLSSKKEDLKKKNDLLERSRAKAQRDCDEMRKRRDLNVAFRSKSSSSAATASPAKPSNKPSALVLKEAKARAAEQLINKGLSTLDIHRFLTELEAEILRG